MNAVILRVQDLDLSAEQVVTLMAVHALNSGLRAFPTEFSSRLYSAVGPLLGQIGGAAVAEMSCPFGDPETNIIQDFDPGKNMYLHCLHAPHHCWTMRGTYIDCP